MDNLSWWVMNLVLLGMGTEGAFYPRGGKGPWWPTPTEVLKSDKCLLDQGHIWAVTGDAVAGRCLLLDEVLWGAVPKHPVIDWYCDRADCLYYIEEAYPRRFESSTCFNRTGKDQLNKEVFLRVPQVLLDHAWEVDFISGEIQEVVLPVIPYVESGPLSRSITKCVGSGMIWAQDPWKFHLKRGVCFGLDNIVRAKDTLWALQFHCTVATCPGRWQRYQLHPFLHSFRESDCAANVVDFQEMEDALGALEGVHGGAPRSRFYEDAVDWLRSTWTWGI